MQASCTQIQRHQREVAFFTIAVTYTQLLQWPSRSQKTQPSKTIIWFWGCQLFTHTLKLQKTHRHSQQHIALAEHTYWAENRDLPSVMYGECISVSSSSCGHPIVSSDLEPWNTEQKQWEFRHNGALKEQQDGTLSTVYFHWQSTARLDSRSRIWGDARRCPRHRVVCGWIFIQWGKDNNYEHTVSHHLWT